MSKLLRTYYLSRDAHGAPDVVVDEELVGDPLDASRHRGTAWARIILGGTVAEAEENNLKELVLERRAGGWLLTIHSNGGHFDPDAHVAILDEGPRRLVFVEECPRWATTGGTHPVAIVHDVLPKELDDPDV